ncbi:hypothetical protein H4R33_001741 [Dimargaris cristalligena]|nr:hypothetical protein H4R33_001741 [Dimargaris cristalligena]
MHRSPAHPQGRGNDNSSSSSGGSGDPDGGPRSQPLPYQPPRCAGPGSISSSDFDSIAHAKPPRRPSSFPHEKTHANKAKSHPASSTSPPQSYARSLADYIRQQLWFVWAGVKDASAWPTSLIVVYGSKTIQQRVLKCVFLNGILFLGSILFYQVVLLRLNWYLLHVAEYVANLVSPGSMESTLVTTTTPWSSSPLLASGNAATSPTSLPSHRWALEILAYTIAFAYNAFWLYPVYCLSFLLNAIWYQEIADRVYSMRGGEPTHQPITYSGLLQSIASEIYRILLFFTYVVWASLIYLIPWVGPVASFIYFCWIYAFYCFEYQWINKNWSFEKRLDYLEGHWAYFLGFGLPCTLCTFFSTQFVSAGVFAFLFPMYIIMANIARPLPRRSDPTIQVRFLPDRLPIFKLSKTINTFLLHQFRRYQYRIRRT